MNYGALETQLVTRLTNHFNSGMLPDDDGTATLMSKIFRAAEGPEDEEQAKKQSQFGKVYVYYLSSDFEDTRGTDAVSQEETIHLLLAFDCYTKRGYNGLYNLEEQVRLALLGFRPENATTRIVMEDGLKAAEFENGSIRPTLKIKFNTLIAQAFDDSEPPFYTGMPNIEYK